MGKPFDLVLGRKTYEIFAGYWPQATEDPAKLLNEARKHVASFLLLPRLQRLQRLRPLSLVARPSRFDVLDVMLPDR